MTLTPRPLIPFVLAALLAGCAPFSPLNLGDLRGPGDAATDATVDHQAADVPRAEVLSVDAPGSDAVVIDTGDAVVVWLSDRPDAPAADAPDVVDVAALDAPADAPRPDVGAPVDLGVDVPPVDAGGACGVLQERCGGVCASLLTDPAHCGACGRACPGGAGATGVCNGGRCELACAAGYADCGDGCVDVRGDHANCGMCGRGCSGTQRCADGACVGCPAGESACEGRCVRLDTAERCGSCSHRCSLGARCVSANRCEYTSCAEGRDAGTWTLCPSGCVDVRGDDQNCLGCGRACPEGTHCLGGVCG